MVGSRPRRGWKSTPLVVDLASIDLALSSNSCLLHILDCCCSLNAFLYECIFTTFCAHRQVHFCQYLSQSKYHYWNPTDFVSLLWNGCCNIIVIAQSQLTALPLQASGFEKEKLRRVSMEMGSCVGNLLCWIMYVHVLCSVAVQLPFRWQKMHQACRNVSFQQLIHRLSTVLPLYNCSWIWTTRATKAVVSCSCPVMHA